MPKTPTRPLTPAGQLARLRWARTTPDERRAHAERMAAKRWQGHTPTTRRRKPKTDR